MKTAGVDLPKPSGDDDELAQPRRRRLFALLGQLGGAASTVELAERLGLHPNGVRIHLQRMREAGLVTHRRAPQPRGPATNGRSRRPPAPGATRLLTALGFQPDIARGPEGRLRCRLGNCPYRDSVRENQAVVCTLHRGLTRGLLDRLAPTATLARFVPHDPDHAGCEIDIDGLAPASD